MRNNNCKAQDEVEVGVSVKVDVAQIVKYVCVTSVFIVAIIFGTNCFTNMLKSHTIEF